MGYYIQTGETHNKASYIINNYGARKVNHDEAERILNDPKNEEGIVVIVDNRMFEAAGYCYSLYEFQAFTDPTDHRPKTILAMNKQLAEKLSGFVQNNPKEQV